MHLGFPLLSGILPISVLIGLRVQGVNADVKVDAATWSSRGVNDWITAYLAKNTKVTNQNFWTEFPKSIGYKFSCDISDDCSQKVPKIGTDMSDDKINGIFVLSAMAHANDAARMISSLYELSDDGSYRSNVYLAMQSGWNTFAVDAMNTTNVPAADFAQILTQPAQFIPGLYTGDGSRNTKFASLIQGLTSFAQTSAFNYTWAQIGANTLQLYYANFDYSQQIMYDQWQSSWQSVTKGQGIVSVIDLLGNGDMLSVPLISETTQSDWQQQALKMFTRSFLMTLFKANGIVLHHQDYTDRECTDITLDLPGQYCDGYDSKAWAPVRFSLDNNGTITRKYAPGASLSHDTTYYDSSPIVIYNASWTCWQQTNADSSKYYAAAWEYYKPSTSLYLQNWDGKPDSFDMALPLCAYNIPVNDQPTDPRDGLFMKEFKKSCSLAEYFDVVWFDVTISWMVYSAFNFAGDAWFTSNLGLYLTSNGLISTTDQTNFKTDYDSAVDSVCAAAKNSTLEDLKNQGIELGEGILFNLGTAALQKGGSWLTGKFKGAKPAVGEGGSARGGFAGEGWQGPGSVSAYGEGGLGRRPTIELQSPRNSGPIAEAASKEKPIIDAASGKPGGPAQGGSQSGSSNEILDGSGQDRNADGLGQGSNPFGNAPEEPDAGDRTDTTNHDDEPDKGNEPDKNPSPRRARF